MLREENRGPTGEFRLDRALSQLAADGLLGDQGLRPLLRLLLQHTRHLMRTVAGSVSLVDANAACYAKVAEHGAPCLTGKSFPLHEGVTGQAVNRRRPVVLDDYRQVTAGHLPAHHPAGYGSVAAAPIWWRGDVIGVNVAFAGGRRDFTAAEVDQFEVLSQAAAPVLARSALRDPLVLRLLGRETAGPGPGGGVPPYSLTPRQLEVLALLADGRSDKSIAAALVLSPKTVEKHVGAVLRRTGATSRTGAVVRAMEWGWLSPR